MYIYTHNYIITYYYPWKMYIWWLLSYDGYYHLLLCCIYIYYYKLHYISFIKFTDGFGDVFSRNVSTPAAPGWEDSHPASWSPPTGEPGRTRENQDGEGRSLYSYHVKICIYIYMILYKNIVIIMLLPESIYVYIQMKKWNVSIYR